ncbi:hypothetical protein CDAR_411991 [Caerostris darwini]|uniref:Uncharacterized protein n=1 Tax=Caerostris darwini TaxID=1538125 RepID=A0AAV4WDP3_9ARAC|nr:hypothetical protein CDAR_411991 [Caerostris darwini]
MPLTKTAPGQARNGKSSLLPLRPSTASSHISLRREPQTSTDCSSRKKRGTLRPETNNSRIGSETSDSSLLRKNYFFHIKNNRRYLKRHFVDKASNGLSKAVIRQPNTIKL